MVTWGGPTWNDLESEQERLYGQPGVELESEPTEKMMELWVSRDAVQTVVQAASQRLSELVFPDAVCRLENALKLVHEAVADAWEDPLDTTPL